MSTNYILRWFCSVGLHDALKTSIELGENVNGKDLSGWTSKDSSKSALMIACENGHYECAKILIDNGADINYKNSSGETALHISQKKNYTKIVALLTWAKIREKVHIQPFCYYWYDIAVRKHYAPGEKYYNQAIQEFEEFNLN